MAEAPIYTPGADTPDDLRVRARALLDPAHYDHVVGGAGDERTVAANRAGFGRYRLRPQALIDVSRIDTSVEILGTKLGAPIFTSPMGGISPLHPDGECGIARAAATAEVGFVLASWAGITLEEAAAAAGPARWNQLYWQGNRVIMADLVHRAEGVGYRAIVLSIDTPVKAVRRRLIRNRYRNPADVSVCPNLHRYTTSEWQDRVSLDERRRIAKGETHHHSAASHNEDLALTWKNVEWLRSEIRVPFVLKGVMTPEDAVRSIQAGADAIMISNHGGRTQDGLPGTIEVLEEVVQAVGGRIPVLIDGGIRCAADIATALGLGAAAVGLGRPVAWALACGGEGVVTAYLENLVEELASTFGMLGVSSAAQMTRDRVSRLDQYVPDSALTPFLPQA